MASVFEDANIAWIYLKYPVVFRKIFTVLSSWKWICKNELHWSLDMTVRKGSYSNRTEIGSYSNRTKNKYVFSKVISKKKKKNTLRVSWGDNAKSITKKKNVQLPIMYKVSKGTQ